MLIFSVNMQENRIITKQEKIKPNKITYQDYENYALRVYKKENKGLPICNVISNNNYSIVMDVNGKGYSKYKKYIVNKYKPNSNEEQGIIFYMKNMISK